MSNKFNINPAFTSIKNEVLDFILHFPNQGVQLYKGSRNELKFKKIGDIQVNIKHFKTPHVINRLAYHYLRKSKAERSFLYASKLQEMGIGTPQPIAFQDNYSLFGTQDSYYASEHIEADFSFRELENLKDISLRNKILQAFTKFTFSMHEHNVYFKDHSRGNTLMKKIGEEYRFYLVDLNRMQFKSLTTKERIQNFERLSTKEDVTDVMAKAYASLIKLPVEDVTKQMKYYAKEYHEGFQRKRKLKNKWMFWRKHKA